LARCPFVYDGEHFRGALTGPASQTAHFADHLDIFAGNRETARETGIRHMADANDESAKKILNTR
jgi:hypothetical protein